MRRHPAILVIGLSFGLVLVGAALGLAGGYRLNLTPSEPLGIWRIVPLDRPVAVGDLVFVCPPPEPRFVDARLRGYLRRGLCPGGFAPLIKTVAALPGQDVVIGRDVVIDGRTLPRSTLRPRDGEGRAIEPHGSGAVPPGHLFLHSPFPSSYDSRYFGPLPADGFLGLARPVLTFAL